MQTKTLEKRKLIIDSTSHLERDPIQRRLSIRSMDSFTNRPSENLRIFISRFLGITIASFDRTAGSVSIPPIGSKYKQWPACWLLLRSTPICWFKWIKFIFQEPSAISRNNTTASWLNLQGHRIEPCICMMCSVRLPRPFSWLLRRTVYSELLQWNDTSIWSWFGKGHGRHVFPHILQSLCFFARVSKEDNNLRPPKPNYFQQTIAHF